MTDERLKTLTVGQTIVRTNGVPVRYLRQVDEHIEVLSEPNKSIGAPACSYWMDASDIQWPEPPKAVPGAWYCHRELRGEAVGTPDGKLRELYT